MEKRIIFAFVLSFGVLYAFRAFYAPPSPPAQQVETQGAAPAPAPAAPNHNSNTVATSTVLPPEPAVDSEIRSGKAEEMVIDTTLYTATVSNIGGILKSFKLKAYTDAEGQPIELINAAGASKVGWPLAIATGDGSVDEALAKASFVTRREDGRVTLEFAEQGVHAVKTLSFDSLNYELQLTTSLSKDGKTLPHSIAWQGGFGDQSVPYDPAKKNLVYESDAKFQRTNLGKIGEPYEVTSVRAGVEDQYFLAMFLLPKETSSIKIHKRDYPGEDGKAVSTMFVAVPSAEPEQGMRVYVGPKNEQWLRKAEPQLARVIDYGFFDFITRPLLVGLLWIHSYVGNFGWAIIILTIVINSVLFPLRLKQQVSMQKMQKIQPQMRTLQDKYKKLKANDPKRAQVQAEMMSLYKQHGVNPMGGCLPLLLQMPFLFAFWNMLSISIELRRAPWILWIKDLSQHDPYYIIPILMAVTMVIMQKMTPTTVDPAQAKMMMIMPLVFSVMFLWMQSGVTLYWLTGNVVGIGQQVFINKYWAPHTEAKPSRSGRKEPRAT